MAQLVSGFDFDPIHVASRDEDFERFASKLSRGWIIAHDRYVRASLSEKKLVDAGWWYNERSNLGMLAAGAWLNKWVALEEFSTRRSQRLEPSPETTQEVDHQIGTMGRADLYVLAVDLDLSAVIEAKQIWPRNASSCGQRAKDCLRQAREQTDSVHAGENYKVDCVFCSPSISARNIGSLEDRIIDIRSALMSVCDNRGSWALGSYFPKRGRDLVTSDTNRIYPGIFLLMRARR